MKSKKFNILVNSKISSFKKTINIDSDKSLSIRGFLIGSISNGVSILKNVLESEDVKSTITACKKLGVKIIKVKSGHYKIFGNGIGSLSIKKNSKLNFGNSGTLARLLIGILSSTPNINISIKGDHSLNKRNMRELFELMSKFGSIFIPKKKLTFPIKFISSKYPVGINYSAGESAQLKSAAILAGLNCYGKTIINEKKISRDHTENLLIKNSKAIKITKKNGIKKITVLGKESLKSFSLNVSGDPSSAAFFTALTLLNKNSSIKIKNVGLNKTRIGFYEILKNKGANIKFTNLKKENNEVKGDIIVKSCTLKPLNTSPKMYPSTTDEYLLLFLIACFQNGVSTFKGIAGLANKESSRALEMKKILSQIGIKSILMKDQIKIFGNKEINTKNKKIIVNNLGDHRIAMCAFILAILTNTQTFIKNFDTVFTSSPSFLKIMKKLGAKFEVR